MLYAEALGVDEQRGDELDDVEALASPENFDPDEFDIDDVDVPSKYKP